MTAGGARPVFRGRLVFRGELVFPAGASHSREGRSRVLEILQTGQMPRAVAGAQPVVTFSSVSEMDHAVPAGVRTASGPEGWAEYALACRTGKRPEGCPGSGPEGCPGSAPASGS